MEAVTPKLADLLRRRRLRRLPTAWYTSGRPGRADWLAGGWAAPGLVISGLASGLQALRTSDGQVAWSWPAPQWAELTAMSDRPVDGVAVAVLAKEDSTHEGTTAVGIEVGSGKELWAYRLPVERPYLNGRDFWDDPARRTLALVPGRAVLQVGQWAVTLDLRTGRPLQPPWAGGDSAAFDVLASGRDVYQVKHTERTILIRRLDLERGGVLEETPVPFDGRVKQVRVMNGAPLALAVTGAGVHAPDDVLLLCDAEGRVSAQHQLSGKEFDLVLDHSRLLRPDGPVVLAGDLLLIPTRPRYGSDLYVTAFDSTDGTVRWTWKSQGRLLGLLPAGDSVLALHHHVPPPAEPDDPSVPRTPTRVTLLDRATGRVQARRRFGDYSSDCLSFLDGTRLIQLNTFRGSASAVELR